MQPLHILLSRRLRNFFCRLPSLVLKYLSPLLMEHPASEKAEFQRQGSQDWELRQFRKSWVSQSLILIDELGAHMNLPGGAISNCGRGSQNLSVLEGLVVRR